MLNRHDELQTALVLVRCSKTRHDDCREIMNAMLKRFGQIQEAYTTNAKVDAKEWCVAASALIPSSGLARFREELGGLTTREDDTDVTVSDLKILASER